MKNERSTRASLEAQLKAALEAHKTLDKRNGEEMSMPTGAGRERRSSFGERLRRLSGSAATPHGQPASAHRKRRLSARTEAILTASSSAIASVFGTGASQPGQRPQPRERDHTGSGAQKADFSSDARDGVCA